MKPTTYCYIFIRYFVEKIILFVFISKISFADIISQQIWCCFHLLVVLHYRLRMTKRNSDWLIRTNFRYLFLEAEFKKNREIFFIACFIYTHNPLKQKNNVCFNLTPKTSKISIRFQKIIAFFSNVWSQYYGELIYQDYSPMFHFQINYFGTRHKIQM